MLDKWFLDMRSGTVPLPELGGYHGSELETYQAIKGYRLMSLSRHAARAICQRLHLTDQLIFFEKYNQSALAPYHNNYHAYCMIKNCYEGAFHDIGIDRPITYQSDLRALIAAALFHDFNHTAGREDDDVNIELAVGGLTLAYGDDPTQQELDAAIDTIKITRYPFTADPRTPIQRIIRDADLMQAYEEDDVVLYKQFLGLKTEVEARELQALTDEEFGVGNRAFYDKITWHTAWAREKALVRDWEGVKQRQQEQFMYFRR